MKSKTERIFDAIIFVAEMILAAAWLIGSFYSVEYMLEGDWYSAILLVLCTVTAYSMLVYPHISKCIERLRRK